MGTICESEMRSELCASEMRSELCVRVRWRQEFYMGEMMSELR